MEKLYFILCHKVKPSLIFTVNYLSSFEENRIIIHVDKKSAIDEFQFLSKENVQFTNKRLDIKWGHISMVDATLLGFEESLNYKFEFLFLISGDDLPVMSNGCANYFLNKNNKDFIHFQDERDNFTDPNERVCFDYPNWSYQKKFSFINKVRFKVFNAIKKNNLDKVSYFEGMKMDLKKGPQWFTLRRSTVLSIKGFLSTNKVFRECFENSYCPDEVFFHTLINHLVPKENFYHNQNFLNDSLRYIDWSTGPDYPRVLNGSDIKKSIYNRYFFARKFSDNFECPLVLQDFLKNDDKKYIKKV